MPMPSDSRRAYSSGEFVLDVDRGALLHLGQKVKLRPKSAYSFIWHAESTISLRHEYF